MPTSDWTRCRWVFGFDWSVPALAILCTSCSAAIFVNLSQFACLGRFSAVSFQASPAEQVLGKVCQCMVQQHCLAVSPELCTWECLLTGPSPTAHVQCKRWSSVQVLGHSKTVAVLLGGWLFLGDHISLKQLLGMLTAVAGMVLYGFATCGPCPCFAPSCF